MMKRLNEKSLAMQFVAFDLNRSRRLLLHMFMLVMMLSIIWSAMAQNSVPYPSMGMNMGGTTEQSWMNLWNCLNPWHSSYGDKPLTVGTDGWPVAGRQHRVLIAGDMDISMTAGVYKLTFKGKANQILVGGSPVTEGKETWNGIYHNIKDDYPKPGYAYMEIHYAIKAETIEFYINGHIEEIKLFRPGFEITDTRTIIPRYTDLLKQFSTLRFKDYIGTDQYDANRDGEVNHMATWAKRTSPNIPQSYAGGFVGDDKGGAWEYVFTIANELDKDVWINIPIKADDDYVLQLAKMIKANLKPTLKVNIEMGNEVWNYAGGFHCFQKTKEICVVYRNSGNPAKTALFADPKTKVIDQTEYDKAATEPSFGAWTAHERFPAFRLKEVIDIFAGVFGWSEINNRIRAVLCGQIGYAAQGHGWCVGPGMDFLEGYYGEGTIRKYLYAVGAAPYFNSGGDLSSVDAIINACRINIRERIFGEFSGTGGGLDGNALEGWLGYAGQYGLKLYCYEGGPDLDYTAQAPEGVRLAAAKDPRMKDLCVEYWNHWFSRYGYDALFCFFGGRFDHSALYTFGEDIDTISTRQAAMYQILSNPSPPFDSSVRHMIPGLIDPRKTSGYNSGWDNGPVLSYQRTVTGSNKWTIAAPKNGTYSFAIKHATTRDNIIDIFLDGVPLKTNVSLPRTGADWTNFVWTDSQNISISMDISYGIHVLRFVYRDCDDNFSQFRFGLIKELPPFMPGAVTGDLTVAIGNPSAQYSVPIDRSVIEYEWDEAAINAAGGRLIPPSGGSGTVRSGQGTAQIFIDWSTVPIGKYTLRVRGKNAVGTSPWRDFTVTIVPGLFTISPNPACITDSVTFTPTTPTGTTKWSWSFGPSGVPFTLDKTDASAVKVKYTASGNKAIKLVITDGAGQTTGFITSLLVGEAKGGAATATPATVAAGASANIFLADYSGRVIRWQRSTDGTAWTDVPTVDLPLNTGAMGQTLWFRAVTKDGGCDETPSTAAKVTVSNPVRPGTVQRDTTVQFGTPAKLTLINNDGTIKRWESSVSPYASWTPINATTAIYTTGNVSRTTQFRAVVTIGTIDYLSLSATVNTSTAPAIRAGRVVKDTTIKHGTDAGTLRLIENDGAVVRWEKSVDPFTSWTTIANITIIYKPGVLTETAMYRAITSVNGAEYPSASAKVTVSAPPTPPPATMLNKPEPNPAGGSLQLKSVAVLFTPLAQGQDSVAEIWYSVTPGSVAGTLTNAQKYNVVTGVPLVLTTGPKAIYFESRPKPGFETRWKNSPVDSALYVYSARTLGVPVPVPGSGMYESDMVRISFEPTDQSAFRQISWASFTDTTGFSGSSLTWKLLDSTGIITLDISGGKRAILFQAQPLPAYSNKYESSDTGKALYVYAPQFTVSRSAYFDKNADGRIDGCRIIFDKDVKQSPIVVILTPPSGGNPIEVVPVRESSTSFYLSFEEKPFEAVETGFSPGAFGKIKDATKFFNVNAFTILDSVAPVIVSATYTLCGKESGNFYNDTLRVVLSEHVKINGFEPFNLFGSITSLTLKDISVNGRNLTALIQIPVGSSEIPHAGDLIAIRVGSSANSLSDLTANMQNNSNNRKVPLTIIPPPDFFKSTAGPTLFNPALGTPFVILIRPNSRMPQLDAQSKASVILYDGVGNKVISGPFTIENGMLKYSWLGRNENGRVVGEGSYLAVVSVTIGGQTEKIRLKIGVRR